MWCLEYFVTTGFGIVALIWTTKKERIIQIFPGTEASFPRHVTAFAFQNWGEPRQTSSFSSSIMRGHAWSDLYLIGEEAILSFMKYTVGRQDKYW